MKKEAQPFKNEMKEMVGVPVLHHDIFTNGIEYFRCFFDVKDLEEYTPYLSLLTELISAMDTESIRNWNLVMRFFCMPAEFRQIWLCTQTVIMTITGIYGRLVEKH